MPDVTNEVLQPTGLTPDAPPAQTPEPVESQPAAPPVDDTGEAQYSEQPADAIGNESQDATDQAPAAPGKPARGVQKALDRLAGEREEWRRIAQAQAQLIESQRSAVQYQAPQQVRQPQQVEQPPNREQFPDWETFNRADATYTARRASEQVVEQRMQQFVGTLLQASVAQQEQARQYELAGRIHTATTGVQQRIPDWDEVVRTSSLPMTPALYEAIAQAKDPDKLMHHLATHPDEHMQIVNMPPLRLGMEVGRIASSFGSPAPSKAPEPGRPVGGRASPSSAYRDDFTPTQHKAWLAKNYPRG